jgi:hypothetical protein
MTNGIVYWVMGCALVKKIYIQLWILKNYMDYNIKYNSYVINISFKCVFESFNRLAYFIAFYLLAGYRQTKCSWYWTSLHDGNKLNLL